MKGNRSVPIGAIVGAVLGAAIGYALSFDIDQSLGALKVPFYMATCAILLGLGGFSFDVLSPAELAARERAPLTAALERAAEAEAEVKRLRSELARTREGRDEGRPE
jgi:hypothetical protein